MNKYTFTLANATHTVTVTAEGTDWVTTLAEVMNANLWAFTGEVITMNGKPFPKTINY